MLITTSFSRPQQLPIESIKMTKSSMGYTKRYGGHTKSKMIEKNPERTTEEF